MHKWADSSIAKTLRQAATSNGLNIVLSETYSIWRNYFNFDHITYNLILNSIKLQTRMYDFCMGI
jgi:hypothetical protein